MKRLSTVERVGLLLALVFIVVGACSIIHPEEGYLFHASTHWLSPRFHGHEPPPEHVTETGSRVYGFLSVGLGVGLARLVFYRPKG